VAKAEFTESERKEVMKAMARAKMAIRPNVGAAHVIAEFGGPSDVAALAVQLEIDMKNLRNNGLRSCEEMLYCQAQALHAVFVDALLQVPKQEWFSTSEAFMRMALKAQNQCRMTLETLAAIKNPPTVFARQANIAQGPQQVNNGMMPAGEPRACAGETQKPQSKLSGGSNELLPDIRIPGAAVGGDSAMATLGTFDSGPKSEDGKARVSRNAYKGGMRARLRELARLLRVERSEFWS
jgi:hypothetical protein